MTDKLDLSQLPPEVRAKVEAGLAKMSPEVRRQWEERGMPMLAKLVNGLAGSVMTRNAPPALPPSAMVGQSRSSPARAAEKSNPYAARRAPHGHYNDTVGPGDSPSLLRWVLMVAAIAIIVALVWNP